MLNGSIKREVINQRLQGAVYKLLGSKDLGLTNDYNTESMPKMLTSLIDGDLAWNNMTEVAWINQLYLFLYH